MQVFAQPIFETAEGWIRNGKCSLAERPVLMRILVRCTYVALTCFVAILIPFFGDLMGCGAAINLAAHLSSEFGAHAVPYVVIVLSA